MLRSRTAITLAALLGAVIARAPAMQLDVAPTREAVPFLAGHAVTTNLLLPNAGYGTEGELRATFSATPQSDGTWSVEATFRPHGLRKGFYNDFGWLWSRVHGSASADAVAQSGVTVQIEASGLYCDSPFTGNRVDLTTMCSFTVDSDGVVTVQYVFV